MGEWVLVPCSVYRGGTSKGVFILGSNLPRDPEDRDRVILQIFGSPDPKQVNGLGGATPTTSKLAIIDRSSRPEADVDYTFGQVSITSSTIDYSPNCGNISSAVGPFAVESGLVHVTGNEATIRIYNTNTNTLITSTFPVHNGHFVPDGETTIAGVPGTASKIVLTFYKLGGAVTGKLLPTGSARDIVTLPDGRSFYVTVIDAGNLTIIMDADELGVLGTELSEPELNRQSNVLRTMEGVRQVVGRQLRLFSDEEVVAAETHAIPKIALVAKPKAYKTSQGEQVMVQDFDVLARVLTMGRLHPSYAVTGAVALAVASKIDGTLVATKVLSKSDGSLRIGHPSGVFETAAEVTREASGQWVVNSVSLVRTARPIMDGVAWVPQRIIRNAYTS